MNKKLVTLLSSATLLAVSPMATLAAITSGPTPGIVSLDANGIVNVVLNFIWPFFMGFAVLMFLIAGFSFLIARGDPTKVETARQAVLWGIVGVVIGLLAFSIPFIVRNTIGV